MTKDLKYCQVGTTPPRSEIFVELRKRWLAVAETRTSSELAKLLDQKKQHVSNWCKWRPAPWWAIMWLCNDLDLVLVFAPGKISIMDKRAVQ